MDRQRWHRDPLQDSNLLMSSCPRGRHPTGFWGTWQVGHGHGWRVEGRGAERVIVWDSTLKTMTWHDLPNKWLTCCDTHPGGFKKWGLPRLTFLVLIFLWHASWRRRRTLRDTANVASVRVKWNPKKIVTITVLIIHHCMWVQPKRIESKNYMKLL